MADKVIVKELVTVLGFKTSRTGLNQADNMLDKFQKKASNGLMKVVNMGKKAVIGVGALFAAITGGSIWAAASMESLTVGFEVLLGSAERAQTLVKDLITMADQTPFQDTDLAKASKTLLTFGITGDNVIDTLRRLGDVAGGSGPQLQLLALSYGQVSNAGKMTGQDLREFALKGFNPVAIMAEKTGKSVAHFLDVMHKGKFTIGMVNSALQSATSEGGLFYQYMLKQSKTFTGVFSTLKGAIVSVGRVWGSTFLEAIKKVASALITLLQGPVMDGVKMLSEKLLPDMATLGDTLATQLSNAGPAIDKFFKKIVDGIDWVKSTYDKSKAYFEESSPLMNTLGDMFSILWDGMTMISDMQMGFTAMLGKGLLKLGLTISWLIESSQILYTSFRKFFSDLGTWFMDGINQATTFFKTEFSGLITWFKEVWGAIGTWFSSMFNMGVEGAKGIFASFIDWIMGWGSHFINVFADIFEMVGFVFSSLFASGKALFMDLLTYVTNIPIVQAFIEPFKIAFDYIGEKVKAIIGWLTSIPGIDIKLPDFPDLDAILNKPKDDLAKKVEKSNKNTYNKFTQFFNTKVNGSGMDGDALAGALGDKVGGMMKAAFSVQLQDVIQVSRGV